MPYNRRTGKKTKTNGKRTRRKGPAPRGGPRSRAQNLQKGVYWFKMPGVINDSAGEIYEEFQPNMVLPNRDFGNVARMFE